MFNLGALEVVVLVLIAILLVLGFSARGQVASMGSGAVGPRDGPARR